MEFNKKQIFCRIFVCVFFFLIMCAFSAGVGIGYLSIDSLNVEIILKNGT